MNNVQLMNNTKWEEVRLAMYALGQPFPKWRTKDVETGHVSDWDGEWFYHFREGGYECIEWVEISSTSQEQAESVGRELCKIHVPGEQIEGVFRVYGYAPIGQTMKYLAPSNNTFKPTSHASGY